MERITGRIKDRRGQMMTGTIVAVMAIAIIMIPITKWLLSMYSGADDLQVRMTMQQILADKWNMINAEDFEALDETIASKGGNWTESLGENGRYTVTTVFGDEGKFEDVQCKSTAPGADGRRCRTVALQITDNVTGKTQGLDLTKADSRYLNSRMKRIEDDLAAFKAATNSNISSLGARVSNLESAVASLGGRVSGVEGRFSSYYTKSETYSRAEIDEKTASFAITATRQWGDCSNSDEQGCSYQYYLICGVGVVSRDGSISKGCIHVN